MPELNLLEEEEIQEPKKPSTTQSSGGGSGVVKILLIFLVLIVVVGAVFFLNQRGIIHLWGPKKAAPTQVAQQSIPEMDEFAMEEPMAEATPEDTSAEIIPLETPPIDETLVEPKEGEEAPALVKEESAMPSLEVMKGAYTVQVFSFAVKENADAVEGRLKEAGYPVFVQKVKVKDKDFFAVRIGKYESRSQAAEAVKSFGYELRANHVIVRTAL